MNYKTSDFIGIDTTARKAGDRPPTNPPGKLISYHSEELRQYAIEKYGPAVERINKYAYRYYSSGPKEGVKK